MSYVDLTQVKGTKDFKQEEVRRNNMGDRVDSSRNPSKVIKVTDLHERSDTAQIRKTFEYVSKYPIIDVRFQKVRFDSASRGTAFVEFVCVQHAREVLTYLRNATPKFNINGKVVHLDYSDLAEDADPNASVQTYKPKASPGATQMALAAAQWSATAASAVQPTHAGYGEVGADDELDKHERKKKKKAREQQSAFNMEKPYEYSPVPAKKAKSSEVSAEVKKQPAAVASVVDLTDDPSDLPVHANLPSMKRPNPALFQYDPDSGYLFDPITGYFYDKPTGTYYDGVKGIWLRWDDKLNKYTNTEDEVQVVNEEEKLKEDLKAWEKQQKKDQKKKDKEKKQTMLRLDQLDNAHKQARAAVQDIVIEEDPITQQPIAVMEETAPVETLVPDDDDVNYDELICNLCRRGFSNRDKLEKHVTGSKLHKTNFAVKYGVSAQTVSQVIDPTVQAVMEITAQQRASEYRDRAAERREKYGVDHADVAKQFAKKGGRGGGSGYVPPNNVTSVDKALDSKQNIGGKLMAKMGWTDGQSLGTHGDGIVAPINATEQRNRNVGLGHEASKKKKGKDGAPQKYKDAARQSAMDRFNKLF